MKDIKKKEKEEEKVFDEVDLGYDKEYFDSSMGMQCKRISYCSCDCDLCVIGGIFG